jgi:hypothetical protein
MEKHVKALTDFPPLLDLKQLQRFLGLVRIAVYFFLANGDLQQRE